LSPFVPEEPEGEIWDVVVVGTGMGGATCGYELARAGKSVLFLERGFVRDALEGVDLSEREQLAPDARLRLGMWPEAITRNPSGEAVKGLPPLGCGSGGGSARYGAVLDRLFPEDFEPGRWFAHAEEASVPESWPIAYEDLRPFYEEAEQLYRVRGTPDPLRPTYDFHTMEPPQVTEKEELLAARFLDLGLHPYRLHQALEFVPGCDKCIADLCPRDCKNDSDKICLRPALREHGAKILPRCTTTSLRTDGRAVVAAECEWRGRSIKIRAKLFVLAAGSFNTPRILLRSKSDAHPDGLANRTGLVGRNLMLHVSEGILLKPKGRQPAPEFNTGISINDFYFDEGEKLGNFHAHSFLMTRPVVEAFLRMQRDNHPSLARKLAVPFHPLIARIGAALYGGTVGFASIMEDAPYERNRVLDPTADEGGAARYEYHFSDELKRRVLRARALFFERTGPQFTVMNVGVKLNLNVSHACGTCRFGDDPDKSVLDANNRAHDVDNLYVADSSFFPTSGGMNPSLTIAANALRVARGIHARGE
jgi:choline dehydrogenase-like flavoprotein